MRERVLAKSNSLTKKTMHVFTVFLLIGVFSSGAWADIAVIVHPDSPLAKIDVVTTAKIFMKKTGDVNGVALSPLDLHKDDPVRKDFYRLVAHRTPDYMLGYWTRLIFTGRGSPPDYVNSQDEMLFAVSRQKQAIGYVDTKKLTDKVKVLLTIKQ